MKLEDLRGWMAGEDCLVVGCGPSAVLYEYIRGDRAHQLGHYRTRWTIGCNRAVKFCSPDFAVCVEPRRDRGMWDIIAEANPLIVFSHIDRPHPRAVLIGSKDVAEWLHDTDQQWDYITKTLPAAEDRKPLPVAYERLRLGQSPFYAAAVAILLGFETIGLIGVDLTEDRYPDVTKPNVAWGRLAAIATELGSRIINLNPDSRLETVPMGEWGEIRTK